jgi:hypothetical protein
MVQNYTKNLTQHLSAKYSLNAALFNINLLSKTWSFFRKSLASSDTITSDFFIVHDDYGNSMARRERLRYGFYLFFNEYSIPQKIFGGGFNYMAKFGKKFDASKLDYPHNPFMNSFLYSGIIGGLAYIYFMFLVFYYYVKYFKYHSYFFVCFIVVFFFSFVSANTHFSIPIFTFLSLIPFLTKYIIEKEKNLSLNEE